MANNIHQEEVLAQAFTHIRVKTRRLAGSAGEQDRQTVPQVLLHLTEHCVHVALHILAALELIALLLCGSTLVDNTEVVGIACPIDHASLLQYIVGYGDESSTAATRLQLVHVLVTSSVCQRFVKIEACIVVVVEGTDLVAKATVHALLLINFGIKEAECIGLHRYSIMSAYTGTSRTSATISRICNLYHFISFTFLRDMVRTKVRINTMTGAVKS